MRRYDTEIGPQGEDSRHYFASRLDTISGCPHGPLDRVVACGSMEVKFLSQQMVSLPRGFFPIALTWKHLDGHPLRGRLTSLCETHLCSVEFPQPGRVRHAHVPRAQMSQFPVCPVSRRTAWRRSCPRVLRRINSGSSSQVITGTFWEIMHWSTVDESVLAAVTRLDRRYDAAATVKSGHLTFTRRGRIQRPPSDYARPAPTRPAPTRAKHFSSGGEGGQGQRAPDGGPSISSCCGNRGQRTEAQRR
jgi:hypothetical protein